MINLLAPGYTKDLEASSVFYEDRLHEWTAYGVWAELADNFFAYVTSLDWEVPQHRPVEYTIDGRVRLYPPAMVSGHPYEFELDGAPMWVIKSGDRIDVYELSEPA